MSGNDSELTVLRSLAAKYFQTDQIELEPLHGDGSDRILLRIVCGENSIIGVHHSNIQENRDFFVLTDFLKRCGIPVPNILSVDSRGSDYLLEDLGNSTLAAVIHKWRKEKKETLIIPVYRQVLDLLIQMQSKLSRLLVSYPNHQKMDRRLYWADLNYFKEHFIDLYGFQALYTHHVQRELEEKLIEPMTKLDHSYFVFRDFQSRNIMWRHEQPVFIDYQSACLGTKYYDLASMLYSSESGLESEQRKELLAHFFQKREERIDYEVFLQRVYRFILARRLRSFGSYGYLAERKDKKVFKSYVSPALDELKAIFTDHPHLDEYPHTYRLVSGIRASWS